MNERFWLFGVGCQNKGPARRVFCHEDGTARSPLMGAPGVASGLPVLGRCTGRMSYREVSVIEVRKILRFWCNSASVTPVFDRRGGFASAHRLPTVLVAAVQAPDTSPSRRRESTDPN
jgi:hypothetical protein